MLTTLLVIAWIIFVGVSIEAGGIIVNAVVTMTKGVDTAKYFWQQVDLSALYLFDPAHFLMLTSFAAIVAILKATLFYLIVSTLHQKKINMSRPFSRELQRFVFTLAYLSLVIGLFSAVGSRFIEWLAKHNVTIPEAHNLSLGGADVWLFMGVVLLVVANIFRKGVEIQSENELTV